MIFLINDKTTDYLFNISLNKNSPESLNESNNTNKSILIVKKLSTLYFN